MKTIADVVSSVPLFASMTPERVDLVAGCGRNVQFGPGTHLFKEGERADVFYLLRDGSVALETYITARGAITLETLGEDDVLGWSWLFPPYVWAFDARATSPVRAIAFDAKCLRGKLEGDPALGYDIMSRFAQVLMSRLRLTRIRLLDVYGDGRDV